MNKYLWIAATVLLVLCLRVNANRTVDGAADCILDPDKKVIWQYGCRTDRAWSVSLEVPVAEVVNHERASRCRVRIAPRSFARWRLQNLTPVLGHRVGYRNPRRLARSKKHPFHGLCRVRLAGFVQEASAGSRLQSGAVIALLACAFLAVSTAAAGIILLAPFTQFGLPSHRPFSRRTRSRALRSFRTNASFSNWLTAPRIERTIVAVERLILKVIRRINRYE